MLLPHKRTFFSYRFLGLPLEGLRNMPGNPIAARNSSDFPVFHMEYELFRLSGKIQSPKVIWLTVRELVQLERITFRAVPLYSGLLFFRSESDTFLMNYNITQTTGYATFALSFIPSITFPIPIHTFNSVKISTTLP